MEVVRSARLALSFDLAAVQTEVAGMAESGWRPHFQTAHYDGGWAVLPLRTIDGREDEFLPFSLDGQPATYRPTPLLQTCPALQNVLDLFRCPVMSVRLLRLEPHAVIKTHRDVGLAFEEGEARVHIPLFTSPAVEFVVDDHPLRMDAGSCWYVNANLAHRVTNRGSNDRIHLVVDCVVDDWLRDLFAEAECSKSVVRRDPAQLRLMIELLSSMNTPVALRLVASLRHELREAQRTCPEFAGTA